MAQKFNIESYKTNINNQIADLSWKVEMMFQVENNPEGYVVSCYHDLQWHPLRNFGERQGDAFAFRDWDCPHLSDTQIRMLEKAYSKERKYIRHSSTIFRIEKGDQK